MTSAIQSKSVQELSTRCQPYALYDQKEGENLTEEQMIDHYNTEASLSISNFFWLVVPRKLVVVGFLTWLFVLKYYYQHCDIDEDDRWVSKTMYMPKTVDWNLLNAVLPMIWRPEVEDDPYWTMPE